MWRSMRLGTCTSRSTPAIECAASRAWPAEWAGHEVVQSPLAAFGVVEKEPTPAVSVGDIPHIAVPEDETLTVAHADALTKLIEAQQESRFVSS